MGCVLFLCPSADGHSLQSMYFVYIIAMESLRNKGDNALTCDSQKPLCLHALP